jgi:hypothetical protein
MMKALREKKKRALIFLLVGIGLTFGDSSAELLEPWSSVPGSCSLRRVTAIPITLVVMW